jgi:hypothetical protein
MIHHDVARTIAQDRVNRLRAEAKAARRAKPRRR